jgi:hypothetical protein
MPASEEAQPAKVAPRSWDPPGGLPVTAFAVVALLASTLGRSIFPALFGAATGLTSFIDRTQHVASFLSQMVAAGGVAFTLRAVATTFTQGSLGIGYRMLVIPAGTAASVLTMAATGRALEPELGCTLVVAALATAAASSAVAMLAPPTRALGFALFLSALAGAFDLAGIRVGQSAVENASATGYKLAGVLMTVGFGFEVLLVSLAFGLLAARRGARALLLSLLSFLLVIFWGYALRGATQPGAPAWEIVVARAVTSWLRAPSPLVPAAARLVLEAASTVGTLALLVASRRAPLAALFALCLLARGATDVPLPALLLVVAALAVPASVQAALPPRGVSPVRGLTPEPTPSR